MARLLRLSRSRRRFRVTSDLVGDVPRILAPAALDVDDQRQVMQLDRVARGQNPDGTADGRKLRLRDLHCSRIRVVKVQSGPKESTFVFPLEDLERELQIAPRSGLCRFEFRLGDDRQVLAGRDWFEIRRRFDLIRIEVVEISQGSILLQKRKQGWTVRWMSRGCRQQSHPKPMEFQV